MLAKSGRLPIQHDRGDAGCVRFHASSMHDKAVRQAALERFPPGPERERWLRWAELVAWDIPANGSVQTGAADSSPGAVHRT